MIMQVHICIPLYMWVYVYIIDPNIAFYFISIYQLNQYFTQIFSVFLVCFVFAKKANSIMDSFTHSQDNFLDFVDFVFSKLESKCITKAFWILPLITSVWREATEGWGLSHLLLSVCLPRLVPDCTLYGVQSQYNWLVSLCVTLTLC